MQTLHSLRLPTHADAGPFARLRALPFARPLAALIEAWRRQGLRRATALGLRSLDDRTLHDLGFHRTEIDGLAAEIGGRAEASYVRALQTRQLRA